MEQPIAQYDAFLSHSSRDRRWVTALARRLEENGFKVCYDVRDFQPSASVPAEIARDIILSRKLIFIATAASVDSSWVRKEINLAVSQNPDNSRRKIIVLLKEKGIRLPEVLADIGWIDFAGGGPRDLSWAKLFAALRDIDVVHPPSKRLLVTLDSAQPFVEEVLHAIEQRRFGDAYKALHDDLFVTLHHRLGTYHLNAVMLSTLLKRGARAAALNGGGTNRPTQRLHTGTAYPPCRGYEAPRGWLMTALALSLRAAGFPGKALPLLRSATRLYAAPQAARARASALINQADVEWTLGRFKMTDHLLRKQIALCRRIGDRDAEVVGHQDLALRSAFRGDWTTSQFEFDVALRLSNRDSHRRAIVLAHLARKELLVARAAAAGLKPVPCSAQQAARKALSAAEDSFGLLRASRAERNLARGLWLIGAAQQACNNARTGEGYLKASLQACEQLHLVELEADVLLDCSRCDAHNREYVLRAVRIAEQCKLVLPAADGHLILATQDARRNRTRARAHAHRAKRLARCDGLPNYAYWAVFLQADRLVQQLEN